MSTLNSFARNEKEAYARATRKNYTRYAAMEQSARFLTLYSAFLYFILRRDSMKETQVSLLLVNSEAPSLQKVLPDSVACITADENLKVFMSDRSKSEI